MLRSEVDGKYWKNYLEAINTMEMILKEENTVIYKLDSNCSLAELDLKIDFKKLVTQLSKVSNANIFNLFC